MRTKKHICDFIDQEDGGIAIVAAAPCLSSVTGMCNTKGVPDGETVNNLLPWPCWQVNGGFSKQRFRSFSSMFNSRGLPCERDVAAILSWPVWRVNGEFNSDLFRSFSSMFSGKGLPCERDVTAILSWPVWQVNSEFNPELPNTPNTCLLYTSPSPRDRQKSRMPSSA